jgi:hypothetical protein
VIQSESSNDPKRDCGCILDSFAKRCNVLCNSLQIVAKLQQNAKRPWQVYHQVTHDIMSIAFLAHLQSVAMCSATLCKSLQTCSKTHKDSDNFVIKSLTTSVNCILNSLARRCNVPCSSLQIVAKLQQNAKMPWQVYHQVTHRDPLATRLACKGSLCKLAGPQRICLQTGRAATDLFANWPGRNRSVSNWLVLQHACFSLAAGVF